MKYSEALSALLKNRYSPNIIKRVHWDVSRVFWDAESNGVRLIGTDSDLYETSVMGAEDMLANDWVLVPSDNLSMLSLKQAAALSKVFAVKVRHPRVFGELLYNPETQSMCYADAKQQPFTAMRESTIGWELVNLGFSDAIIVALEMDVPIRRRAWAEEELIKYTEQQYHFNGALTKYSFTLDNLSAVPARDIKATDWEPVYSAIKKSREITIAQKIICTTVEAFARAQNYAEKIKRCSWDTDFIRYNRDTQTFLLNDTVAVSAKDYGEYTQDWLIVPEAAPPTDYLAGMNYIEAVEESKKGNFAIKLSSWEDQSIIYSATTAGMVFTADQQVFNPTLEQITAKDWILVKPADMFLLARRRMLGVTNPNLVRLSADISEHEPNSILFKYDWIKASKPEVWSMVDSLGKHSCWIEDNSREHKGALLLSIFNSDSREIVFGQDWCQTTDGQIVAFDKTKFNLQYYLFSR